MEKNLTALICCFVKAYHNLGDGRKIYKDDLSRRLLSDKEYLEIAKSLTDGIAFFAADFAGDDAAALEWIAERQLAPSVLARSAFTHRAIESEKRLGLRKYVALAAGYDAEAYRHPDLRCFEIDRSEMIDDKIRRLKNAGISDAGVRYIRADFSCDSDFCKAIDFSEKTLCSMLGLSYYLKSDDFFHLLRTLGALMERGSAVVFDYPMRSETISQERTRRLAAAAGERMQAKYMPAEIARVLAENDMQIYEHLSGAEASGQLFSDYNNATGKQIKAPDDIAYCLAVKY